MALINTSTDKAEVRAMGSSMNATVNFSGALMEMLATVYANILMSAIREAIQNASDAAKRAGLSFAEGVLVQLPTPSNPMVTVIDKGSGMTKAFMEDPAEGYLSYGSSTKAGDNGAAGGLGIGRWAAYGYIRECYITTCHESDMVERTYFQFQGDHSTPKVQLASEVPGKVTGTKVSFPVKETDLDEALRAVAWLKDVMQLTMGDSFSVDNPHALPAIMPEFSGTVLSLGEFDVGLAGVLVYPMKGNALKYSRQGLQDGSLVVLTNKAAGVGGLPFHVQSPSNSESVFHNGMVVEIPMSLSVPFMPSREELKYTDEVYSLLKRIDIAAALAVEAKARELFHSPTLASKAVLSDLLGTTELWHWFARGARQPCALLEALRKATGGECWNGRMNVLAPMALRTDTVSVRFRDDKEPVLRTVYRNGGYLHYQEQGASRLVQFTANKPLVLVVNDVPTGGVSRFREWLRTTTKARQYLLVSSPVAGEAATAVAALNDCFGGELPVVTVSSMPVATSRVIVGSKVVSVARGRGSLTYYSCSSEKQETSPLSFATYAANEPVRVWLGKDGGQLAGFSEDTGLTDLASNWAGRLSEMLPALGVSRLYLLTKKQVAELSALRADAERDGLLDMADDEFPDDEAGRETLGAVKALKSWLPLEEALAGLVKSPDIQNLLVGKKVRMVDECWEFKQFCEAMAERPRMELTGTSLDKALSPFVDLLTGVVMLKRSVELDPKFPRLCAILAKVGNSLEAYPDDTAERTELISTLKQLDKVGHLNYKEEFKKLRQRYPLLSTVGKLHDTEPGAMDHLCLALAAIYR